MATLSTTSPGGMAKYAAPLIDAVTDSMRTGTPLGAGGQQVVIRNVAENIETLNLWLKLATNRSTEREAIQLELVTARNDKIKIARLDKPKKGAGGNRGDIAEGILGAAIAARFINKNRPIERRDIHEVIKRMKGSGSRRDTQYKSPNANESVIDDVRFFLALAKPNMDALSDPKNFVALEDLFDSAVKYANGKTVVAWSELLYYNNQYNFIEVISDGLGGQRSTKIDVAVKVDDKPTDINISLKAGDVKQFGQVGGIEFEKQEALWNNALGIDIKILEAKYQKLVADHKAIDAIYEVYNFVQRRINSALSSSTESKKMLDTLAEGILYFATLREKDVTLVQLDSREAKIYNFSNVKPMISSLTNLRADLKDSAGKPKLTIRDSASGKALLEFRVKQENKPSGEIYIRNYIEKGELLSDLIAVYA